MVMLCASISASAYDFEVDEIYYDVNSLEEMTCDVAGCSSTLTELIIPEYIQLNGRVLKVCDIKDDAFSNNHLLTKVVFNAGLQATVGNNAFSGCKNLAEIHFNDVINIGKKSFYNCPKLKKIDLPGSVYNIGQSAFALSKIDSSEGIDVSFENGDGILNGPDVKDKVDLVFYNRNIKSVNLNRNITNFGDTWGMLRNVTIGSEVTMFPSYMGRYLNNVDLSTTNVTEICDNAFLGSRSNTIYLPSKLNSIGSRAFAGTSRLESIILPNTLIEIGDYAFQGSSINSIQFPNTLESIGYGCFSDCSNLTGISIPGSLTIIPSNAFHFCYNITEVDMLDGTEYIDEDAFYDCRSLTKIRFSNTLKRIGKDAFRDTKIQSVIIPSSVDTIYDGALGESLEKIIFEPSNNPLYYYSKEIDIKSFGPTSHPTYGYPTYEQACAKPQVFTASYQSPFIQNSLTELSLGRTLVTLSYLYGEDDELPNDEIRSRTYMIWNRNYSHMLGVSNNELQKVTIHDEIDNPFLVRDSLKSNYTSYYYRQYYHQLCIDEHNYVTNFAPILSAGKLQKLKEIRCMSATPPNVLEDFPVGVYMSAKVYVPQGSLNDYKNDPYWGKFWSIEEMVISGIDERFAEKDSISIVVSDCGIQIFNKDKKTLVRVFSISGSLIAETTNDLIPNIPCGIYIINIGNKNFKIKI